LVGYVGQSIPLLIELQTPFCDCGAALLFAWPVRSRIIVSMVLRKLRVWGDMWRVRRFWKLRLAVSVVALGVVVWMCGADLSSRNNFYVFLAAVWVPTLVNLALSRSDAGRERERTAPKFDVYTGESLDQTPPAAR
jgi:hypothetical protein